MARPNKPWYREASDSWVTKRHGRQHTLAHGKGARAEALRAFHRLMLAEGGAAGANLTVEELADLLMDEVKERCAPLTYAWYQRYLGSFLEVYGSARASAILPLHIGRWLAKHRWNETTQAGAITAVKRLFRWARRQGYLDADPLEHLERPTRRKRGRILDAEGLKAILDVTPDREFRNLLTILDETGMRPSEAMRLEARMIDWERGAIVMASKTTRRTGRPRVIYMIPRVAALIRELTGLHPEGPILRNTRGKPWTRYAMACRFADLRERLGLGAEATAESLRHRYITDGLVRGVPIATMAALVGHTDTTMVAKEYSKLYQEDQHLRDAARAVRPGSDLDVEAVE